MHIITKTITAVIFFSAFEFNSNGQQVHPYNLAQLLKENRLDTNQLNEAHILNDTNYHGAVSSKRIVWLKDVSFKEGTIDIDLRGKDVFCKAFLALLFMRPIRHITR